MCKLEHKFVESTLDIFLCFNYIFMLQIYFFKCISSYLSLNSCFILRPQMSAREFSQWLKLVDADILFIYISCNPLSWFSLLEAPIPSSLPVLLYRCFHTHLLLPPHPDISLHWGMEPLQDQRPLLSLMPDKAIHLLRRQMEPWILPCVLFGWWFSPCKLWRVWLVDIVVLPMGCKPLQLLESCL